MTSGWTVESDTDTAADADTDEDTDTDVDSCIATKAEEDALLMTVSGDRARAPRRCASSPIP